MTEIQAFRIQKSSYNSKEFWEGTLQNSSRWNKAGTKVIYTSCNLSLATLELVVRGIKPKMLRMYSYFVFTLDPKLILEIEADQLSSNQNKRGGEEETMDVSGQWIHEDKSPVLKVPTVITPGESNYLLNPIHADYKQVKVKGPFSLDVDKRLVA